MTIIEIVTLLKDVLLGGAAITGAFIANKGLTTWKRQLSGNSEYELSRRILVTLYKYRDAINGVRNPFIWNYEMPTPPEDQLKKMTPLQVSFFGTQKAYEARWESVQIERRNLYVHLLEAEAIWVTALPMVTRPCSRANSTMRNDSSGKFASTSFSRSTFFSKRLTCSASEPRKNTSHGCQSGELLRMLACV